MPSKPFPKFVPYYTLLAFDKDSARWSPQWGSYVRSEVVAEREEYRREYAAKYLRVVAVADDSQTSINALVELLNSPVRVGM